MSHTREEAIREGRRLHADSLHHCRHHQSAPEAVDTDGGVLLRFGCGWESEHAISVPPPAAPMQQLPPPPRPLLTWRRAGAGALLALALATTAVTTVTAVRLHRLENHVTAVQADGGLTHGSH